MMAARISELFVDPHFGAGANDTTQYVELRGVPHSTLDEGTYFVIVEESGSDIGGVHGIFDLSGQAFGANGYLTLLQKDSPHQVDPASALLQSTEKGFGGLPGGIYTDSHPLSDRIDFVIGANGYFLIQTDVAPVLEMDIDVEDDGVMDPWVSNAWDILDSISLHPFVGGGDHAYGNIVFVEKGAAARKVAVAEGGDVIVTEGFGYAGRVGESEGHSADDWIAGTSDNEITFPMGNEERWGLVDNLFGEPSQYVFAGRDLDHVGGPNFVGGVKGRVLDVDGQSPASGVSVFADTNNNGVLDRIVHTVEPDAAVDLNNLRDENGFERDVPLLNAYPGVTITKFALGSFPSSEVTTEKEDAAADDSSNRVFATGGIDWFTKEGVLRFDFYEPIGRATIEAIGGGNALTQVYGRLDAYNKDGELLDTVVSGLLGEGQRESITVSSDDEIAYLFAYADTQLNDGEGDPWGMFDELVYTQWEPHARTDQNGDFYIKNLFPGDYQVRAVSEGLHSMGPAIRVDQYEHFDFRTQLAENARPTIQSATFEFDENPNAIVSVGNVIASDPEGGDLVYRIATDDVVDFEIDSVTGEITTRANSVFDFEVSPTYELAITAEDPLGATTTATMMIHLVDQNEAPTIDAAEFSLVETSAVGVIVGRLAASDPDTGQSLSFEVIDGNDQRSFAVSEAGEITLAAELDFELETQYSLLVQVSDDGDQRLSDRVTVLINVIDENDPPSMADFTASIPENAGSGVEVGRAQATDSDAGQSISYQIVEGNEDGRFRIHPNTGVVAIEPDAGFDFESEPQVTLVISARDSGVPSAGTTAELTVSVTNIDEAPVFLDSVGAINAITGDEVSIALPGDLVADPDGEDDWGFSASIGGDSLPSWLTFDPINRLFFGIPTSIMVGPIDIDLSVFDADDPTLFSTLPFTINVSVSEKPLHNSVMPQDVNGDASVTANDALRIINFLAVHQPGTLYDQSVRADAFYDVSGDNFVTALDALQVINAMARSQLSRGNGEQAEEGITAILGRKDDRTEAADEVFASSLF